MLRKRLRKCLQNLLIRQGRGYFHSNVLRNEVEMIYKGILDSIGPGKATDLFQGYRYIQFKGQEELKINQNSLIVIPYYLGDKLSGFLGEYVEISISDNKGIILAIKHNNVVYKAEKVTLDVRYVFRKGHYGQQLKIFLCGIFPPLWIALPFIFMNEKKAILQVINSLD